MTIKLKVIKHKNSFDGDSYARTIYYRIDVDKWPSINEITNLSTEFAVALKWYFDRRARGKTVYSSHRSQAPFKYLCLTDFGNNFTMCFGMEFGKNQPAIFFKCFCRF